MAWRSSFFYFMFFFDFSQPFCRHSLAGFPHKKRRLNMVPIRILRGFKVWTSVSHARRRPLHLFSELSRRADIGPIFGLGEGCFFLDLKVDDRFLLIENKKARWNAWTLYQQTLHVGLQKLMEEDLAPVVCVDCRSFRWWSGISEAPRRCRRKRRHYEVQELSWPNLSPLIGPKPGAISRVNHLPIPDMIPTRW